MSEADLHAGNLKLLGGQSSLDFVNTVAWHASDHPHEYLTTFGDLIAWSQHVGLLSNRTARVLVEKAHDRRIDADAVLQRALKLREALYRIYTAIAHGKSPVPGDLELVNQELAQALPKLHMVRAENGFTWEWQKPSDALDQMLWPVARSAAELLTSEDLHRIRQCADTTDGCGWLFLDMSKNRTRRWCDMKDCGNRAKARRYHGRQRRTVNTVPSSTAQPD